MENMKYNKYVSDANIWIIVMIEEQNVQIIPCIVGKILSEPPSLARIELYAKMN